MSDANEALRALEQAFQRLDAVDGLYDWSGEYNLIRAHLTAPRVPEEAIRKNAPRELDISEQLAWAEGWNACREAMLAAATKETSHD